MFCRGLCFEGLTVIYQPTNQCRLSLFLFLSSGLLTACSSNNRKKEICTDFFSHHPEAATSRSHCRCRPARLSLSVDMSPARAGPCLAGQLSDSWRAFDITTPLPANDVREGDKNVKRLFPTWGTAFCKTRNRLGAQGLCLHPMPTATEPLSQMGEILQDGAAQNVRGSFTSRPVETYHWGSPMAERPTAWQGARFDSPPPAA
ncbi:hypothetical protein B0H63DRAFT_211370 [Podospora didyma]|uniref:Uncharacterized protein n=1 Tax=Podospora didyma TaxID=330526 RepID=A0AAE0NHM6_9PEZI|nr:hypothetical protein B0H63DRAFT_211370 [Podospora didyma]